MLPPEKFRVSLSLPIYDHAVLFVVIALVDGLVLPISFGQNPVPKIEFVPGTPAHVSLNVTLNSSQACVLQQSHDLVSWEPVGSYPTLPDPRSYETRVRLESPRLFFRLALIDMQGVPDVREGLVAEFKFDETSGSVAMDTSESGLEGFVRGQPEWVQGYCGSALKFDGIDDYVHVGDRDEIEVNTYTVAAWCKSDGNTTDHIRQEILEKADSYWMNIRNDSQLVRSGGFYGDCSIEQQWFYTDSETPVQWNTWYHLAASYDGTRLRVYINGQLQSDLLVDLPHCIDRDKLLVIGAKKEYDDTPAEAYFSGTLDEVRIYARSLTQEEIIRVMHACAL